MSAFFREDGTKLTKEEVILDALATIHELRHQLAVAQEFKLKLEQGRLEAEDSYLSFGIVVEEGYDRTGPSYLTYGDQQ